MVEFSEHDWKVIEYYAKNYYMSQNYREINEETLEKMLEIGLQVYPEKIEQIIFLEQPEKIMDQINKDNKAMDNLIQPASIEQAGREQPIEQVAANKTMEQSSIENPAEQATE